MKGNNLTVSDGPNGKPHGPLDPRFQSKVKKGELLFWQIVTDSTNGVNITIAPRPANPPPGNPFTDSGGIGGFGFGKTLTVTKAKPVAGVSIMGTGTDLDNNKYVFEVKLPGEGPQLEIEILP